MSGASFVNGLMQGYGFVDNVYRQNEYDKQRADSHAETMKLRKLQTQSQQWQNDDEAARRAASEFASAQLNPPPRQADPGAMPAAEGVLPKQSVPGVEVSPVAPGSVPPVGAPPALPKAEAPAPMPATPPASAAPMPQPAAGSSLSPVMPPAQQRAQQAEIAARAAALRQQWYMENGKSHLALKDMEEVAPKLEQFRNQAWQSAMRRYAVTQDPNEFVRAYKYDLDGFDVTGIKPAGRNEKGEDVFTVEGTQDGKPIPAATMTRTQIEAQARQASDPTGYQKMLDERRKAILESQLRTQETMAKERFQKAGNFLVDTQSGKVFDGNMRPMDEFTSGTEEDADGTKRLVIYNKRTGQRTEDPGANDPMAVLPKAVRDVADKAGAAVDTLLKTDAFGGMTGDNARLAPQAREVASSLIAANHRDAETYAGLTPARAAQIGLGVAKGELKVGTFTDGPYKGERLVEFEGRKYLLNPYAWQKFLPQRGGPASAPPAGQAPAPAPSAPELPRAGPRAAPAGPTRAALTAPFPLSGAPALAPVGVGTNRVAGPITQ